MKEKLKVIKNWEFEEFELTGTSFKYSPTGCKGMVARSEDEIVFWTYHLLQKCSGVLWVKGEVSRWIPSPEPKEQQDVWEVPVLLSCDRGILLVCPASKSLWWMPQMDGEWIPIPMDNWCAQGIPKPVAVTGSHSVFPIVCRVDNSADATNSFTSLPETAAKAAKQLWKSKPGMDLRITKPRKPEWLAQNLDNPFRGWDGAEHIPAAAAKKAANQYRKTRSLLMKLAAEPGEDAQAQALDAVAAYTQTFNKMGFIETEKRDEIYMALRGILDALPDGTLQKDALMEKFEQLRDF